MLATQYGGTTIFSDYFDSSPTQWTVHSGTWSVQTGEYVQTDTSIGYKISYAGQASWTDYVIEARAKHVGASYGAQIAARLNPSTGARYAFWIYPNPTEGPNRARLINFDSWDHWTTIADSTAITTSTDWHTLKMELIQSNIKCYYDGSLVFDVTDTSYTSGAIGLETYGAEVHYDWVTVESSKGYCSSGTLVSTPFNAGFYADWLQIAYTASTPTDTQLEFRTRTASTQAGLSSAPWSDYYLKNTAAVTSPDNRWIQYRAEFETTDNSVTPALDEVTIYYTRRAYIESCDASGNKKDQFNPGETIRINGSSFSTSQDYNIYIVHNTTWYDDMLIPSRVSGTNETVSSDSSGNIPPARVWLSAQPGKIDIDGNGRYEVDVDALDDLDISGAGFFVIPEYALGTILALAVCFAGVAVYRRSKRTRLKP
jgi:hypothetical protein